jgi:quinol monooxygenase YgiN
MSFPVKGSLFALAVSLCLASTSTAQDNPVLAAVKESLKDTSKPFAMGVIVKVKEGQAAKFEAAMAKVVKATRQEKGCIAYDLSRDAKDELRYVVYERWRNYDALVSHMDTPYLRELLAQAPDLFEGPPDVHVLLPVAD